MADGTHGRLEVAVATPEGAAFEGGASDVVVPAFDGEWAFLPGHAPFVALLGQGELRVRETADAAPKRWFLDGGVVQVADDRVVVLAEAIVRAEAIDRAADEAALARLAAERPVGEAALDARLAAMERLRRRLRIAGDAGPHARAH